MCGRATVFLFLTNLFDSLDEQIQFSANEQYRVCTIKTFYYLAKGTQRVFFFSQNEFRTAECISFSLRWVDLVIIEANRLTNDAKKDRKNSQKILNLNELPNNLHNVMWHFSTPACDCGAMKSHLSVCCLVDSLNDWPIIVNVVYSSSYRRLWLLLRNVFRFFLLLFTLFEGTAHRTLVVGVCARERTSVWAVV